MRKLTTVVVLISLLSAGCKDGPKPIDLVFAPSDDVALGNQLHDEILANPEEYPLLDETEHADAIAYLQNMADQIIESGELDYAETFDYKVHIIDADVLNAFAGSWR